MSCKDETGAGGENVVYSEKTKHSAKTVHRLPSNLFNKTTEDVKIPEVFFNLSSDLYPTGRAWRMKECSSFENLHKGLNLSSARLVLDGMDTIETTLPDTFKFGITDIRLWEYRLGLISNESTIITDRRAAVLRKLGFPSNIKARQNAYYMTTQLRKAGFNVSVHENTIPYRTPEEIINIEGEETQHGGTTQHGDNTTHGAGNYDVIANSVEPAEDYAIGGEENLWATFYLANVKISQYATVPAAREREFRELVLKLKPAHTVAFTFINYTS